MGQVFQYSVIDLSRWCLVVFLVEFSKIPNHSQLFLLHQILLPWFPKQWCIVDIVSPSLNASLRIGSWLCNRLWLLSCLGVIQWMVYRLLHCFFIVLYDAEWNMFCWRIYLSCPSILVEFLNSASVRALTFLVLDWHLRCSCKTWLPVLDLILWSLDHDVCCVTFSRLLMK